MTTRFRTRAFLICFVPFAGLLGGSFWMMQRFVQATVHDGLRASLRENQSTIANMRARGALQNSRFLRVAGENASLKAGIQLLLSNPGSPAARRTVEDQLRELGEHMGFDFLLVSASDGAPLAGVVRQTDVSHQSQLVPLESSDLDSARSGLLALNGHILQVASVAIDQDNGNLGSLSVGEYFTFSGLPSPAVLLRNGRVIASTFRICHSIFFPPASPAVALDLECDLQLETAGSRLPCSPGTVATCCADLADDAGARADSDAAAASLFQPGGD